MPVSNELLDIIACPMCKGDIEYRGEEDFYYCEKDDIRYYGREFKGKVCPKCNGNLKEIEGEVLICKACSRWYPIIDDIPHMLPDELREDLS
ncbi:hypothetical protein BMS3Bbin15_01745 [archaeon BMS3Bbin15]|nr:hypothetical protein BMS3Bbin15_01745 [archaeon BMS3Bbin15]